VARWWLAPVEMVGEHPKTPLGCDAPRHGAEVVFGLLGACPKSWRVFSIRDLPSDPRRCMTLRGLSGVAIEISKRRTSLGTSFFFNSRQGVGARPTIHLRLWGPVFCFNWVFPFASRLDKDSRAVAPPRTSPLRCQFPRAWTVSFLDEQYEAERSSTPGASRRCCSH